MNRIVGSLSSFVSGAGLLIDLLQRPLERRAKGNAIDIGDTRHLAVAARGSRYPADGGGTVELLTGKESRDDRPDLERCRSDFGRGEAHRARGKWTDDRPSFRRRPLTAVVQ
jgi:hypothetical protein